MATVNPSLTATRPNTPDQLYMCACGTVVVKAEVMKEEPLGRCRACRLEARIARIEDALNPVRIL